AQEMLTGTCQDGGRALSRSELEIARYSSGGGYMQFQKFGERYIVRLESDEPVVDTLQAFLKAEGVESANISAIGAVKWVQLGYWNASTRAYEYREVEEQLEVLSLSGNCSKKEGEPFLHLHVILGRRDFSLLGGHLKEARVHPTLEVWLRTETTPAHRRQDEGTGLYLLDLH